MNDQRKCFLCDGSGKWAGAYLDDGSTAKCVHCGGDGKSPPDSKFFDAECRGNVEFDDWLIMGAPSGKLSASR